MLLRKREFAELNYKSIFYKGKTIRQKIHQNESFKPLPFAELEDVAINSKCLANCSYCYTSATKLGKNFDNVVEKALEVYGSMNMNERPYQLAIGGAGEPTLHPDFPEFVKTISDLNILPNYTTNGMHLTDKVIEATQKYCGGVAVSYHPHIEKVFHKAIAQLTEAGIRTNIHFIVGEEGSSDKFFKLYDDLQNIGIEYFVLLPYQAVGRGKQINVIKEWDKLFKKLLTMKIKNMAFGALFYDYINNNDFQKLDLDVYEPEVFSGYRMFDDSYKLLRKSSYDLKPKIDLVNV